MNWSKINEKRYSRKKLIIHVKDEMSWIKGLMKDSETKLDYGGGRSNIKQYGIKNVEVFDIDPEVKPDYTNRNKIKKKYDWIIISHVIEHMNIKDLENCLKWCSKHCNKLFIVTPNLQPFNMVKNFWIDSTHVRPYDHNDLCTMLEEEGFKTMNIIYSAPLKLIERLLCNLYKCRGYNHLCVYAIKE